MAPYPNTNDLSRASSLPPTNTLESEETPARAISRLTRTVVHLNGVNENLMTQLANKGTKRKSTDK